MLRFLKSFFGKHTPPAEPEVSYKVEAPVAQPQCGCGRSASGFCVGLHKLTAEEWAAHPDNPVKPEPKQEVVKKPAAPKKTAATTSTPRAKTTAKKPAAITAAANPKTRAKKPAK